jgi:peptidoglycan hydrolase CwlO-like protein
MLDEFNQKLLQTVDSYQNLIKSMANELSKKKTTIQQLKCIIRQLNTEVVALKEVIGEVELLV